MRPAQRAEEVFVSWYLLSASQRCGIRFASADAHRLLKAENKDLAVSDLARLGGRRDGLDGLFGLVGRDRDLDLQLRQEAHGIFSAAIDFGMALLTPVTFDFSDGHTVHANRGKRVADLVELKWLDDSHDNFHGFFPPLRPILSSQIGRSLRSDPPADTLPTERSPAFGNQTPCQFCGRPQFCWVAAFYSPEG